MVESTGAEVRGRKNRVAGRDYFDQPVIVLTAPAVACAALGAVAGLLCVALGMRGRPARRTPRPRART